MKLTIEATIPTTQYGNIRPTFSIEKDGEEKEALDRLKNLWSTYGESPLKEKTDTGAERIVSFNGEELMYNPVTHTYTDMDGSVLLSGSVYAESKSPKFDKEAMLPRTAKAWGVDADDIDTMWSMSGDISTGYGTALHNALEIYHKYKDVGEKVSEKKELDYNYALPKNPHIRGIVQEFDELYGTDAVAEPLISDLKNKRAGQVDRLEVDGKTVRIGDYKFIPEMDSKKLKKYQHQLSFYADIMKSAGYTVAGLDLYIHDGQEWRKEELEILPIE